MDIWLKHTFRLVHCLGVLTCLSSCHWIFPFDPGASAADGGLDQRTDLQPVEAGADGGTGTRVAELSLGARHSCARLEDGGLWCWGDNLYGQLAAGPVPGAAASPTLTVDLGSLAAQIAAGGYHTCALLQDNTVHCWGRNNEGQVGVAESEQENVPQQVAGLAGVVQLALGEEHSCARLASGQVRCWGSGDDGQLGNGAVASSIVPVAVSNMNAAHRVSCGNDFCCAVEASGTLRCWGENNDGQLGDGTETPRVEPALVMQTASSPLTGVERVAGGANHACAIAQGAVWCWGQNSTGQLGDGTTDSRPTPAPVLAGLDDATELCAGNGHSCAVTQDGALWCWGDNLYGQLGVGQMVDTPAPFRTRPIRVPVGASITSVSCGGQHTCALDTDGTTRCWGNNTFGQIGNGTATRQAVPRQELSLVNVQRAALGERHSCAWLGGGTVSCWGFNHFAQLGRAPSASNPVPADVPLVFPDAAYSLTAGANFNCLWAGSTGAWCWGQDSDGQLGNGVEIHHSATPLQVQGLIGNIAVAAVAAGKEHACALLDDGTVWCWGENGHGELGDGATVDRLGPVQAALPALADAVAAGRSSTCAWAAGSTVWCWGNNSNGQLGDGTETDRSTPTAVNSVTAIQGLAMGNAHTCAIESTLGKVSCWGNNARGQLGNGTTSSSTEATKVSGIDGAVQLALGGEHSCALLQGGKVYCWGDNLSYQLGATVADRSSAPVLVQGLPTPVDGIVAGGDHTCALAAGALYCWGSYSHGQLGSGLMADSWTPVLIAISP